MKVTATNGAGTDDATSAASDEVEAAPPANTAAPTISGAPTWARRSPPTTAAGPARDPIDYAYQWRRCDANGENCNDITGADAGTYTLTAADVDNTIRVKVTATNAGGSGSATSDASGPSTARAREHRRADHLGHHP